MYKNEISKTSEEDLQGEELILSDIFYNKRKIFIEKLKAEEIAHYLMLWLKYYRLDRTTYDLCAISTIKENIPITEKSQNRIIKRSKKILLEKYHITIESENPLILSSRVPFNEIDEKGDIYII